MKEYHVKKNAESVAKIFPSKHDWRRTYSSKYLDNLQSITNGNVKIEETGRKDDTYSCSLCKNVVQTSSDLDTHIKKIHGSQMEDVTANHFHQHNSEIVETKIEETLENENIDHKYTDKENTEDADDIEQSVANLCLLCLLSFKNETDLNQHIPKHKEQKMLPSILKNK